jgi:hypothetical protein
MPWGRTRRQASAVRNRLVAHPVLARPGRLRSRRGGGPKNASSDSYEALLPFALLPLRARRAG